MLVALFLVVAVSNKVFLGNTPRISQGFITNLANFPNRIAMMGQNIIVFITQKSDPTARSKQLVQEWQKLPISALNTVGQGVYAKEDNASNTVYIRITKDAQYDSQVIQGSGGKQYTIYYPKPIVK